MFALIGTSRLTQTRVSRVNPKNGKETNKCIGLVRKRVTRFFTIVIDFLCENARRFVG